MNRASQVRPVRVVVFGLICLAAADVALAHVSEQGLVLLLPTRIYISAGVLAVALTVVLLALVPATTTHSLLLSHRICRVPFAGRLRLLISLLTTGCLFVLMVLGVVGPRDPLKNPLPLYIWTFWWIGLVGLQGFIGNLWHWINPWSGVCQLLGVNDETAAGRRLHRWGVWPAVALFLLFIMFALAFPAPDDPDVLAAVVFAYWFVTLIAMMIFGQRAWSECGEFVTIVMMSYARMSPLMLTQRSHRASHRAEQHAYLGMPGSRAFSDSRSFTGLSMAVFVLVLLGTGSFDGLNETFWWLSAIGVNPLEFPGRSAIIGSTVIGIIAANTLLVAAFFVCVWLGVRLVTATSTDQETPAGTPVRVSRAFAELGVSMLPIAFAYHLAHYLVTFLVNGQYVIAATSDPLGNGADLLQLGTYYVTTGFLNTHHSVELLWLFQAGIVVLGHIVSVVLAHGIAVRLFGNTRRAALSQLPLAIFMILYTFLGLWLLASPKGG